jgi:phosphate starvation-inducible PhoH-like protein
LNKSVPKNKKLNLKFVYSENNTISIIFSNNQDLLGVIGEFNNNIKELERITNTSIYSRGNSIILKNDEKKMRL